MIGVSSRPYAHCVVPVPHTSAPLGARYSVMLWVGGAGGVDVGVVLEDAGHRHRRRGQPDARGRAPAVVGVDVELEAERVRRQDASARPGWSWATEVLRQKRSREYSYGTSMAKSSSSRREDGGEQLAGEGVLGSAAALGRRAEAGVAPRPGPLRTGIDLGVVDALLVADERSIRAVAGPAIDGSYRVRQNTSLPVMKMRWTPASRAASTLARIGPRPVLVVAGRDEHLAVQQRRAGSRWVSTLPQYETS